MRRRAVLGGLAIAAAMTSATACDQLFGIDERPLLSQTAAGDATTGADAPNGDAPSVSSDAVADASATDAPPCSGPTIYVSTKGNDSSPGCDPSNPKATIANAITASSSPDAGITTIEVCAGTYPANGLTLDTGASLMGGYSCSTWARTATYGYPSFDATNETVLEVTTSNVSGATLTITGSSGTVDGFTIQGQLTGSISATAAAIRVTGLGTPTISNDHLLGGATTYAITTPDPTPASAGLVVDDGASPIVTMDTIEGGSGTTPAGSGTGSAGVYTTGANGAVTITGCTIRGGSGRTTGTSGSGSQGLLLNGSTGGIAYTIVSSAIQGGTGSTASCSNVCRATRGVNLTTGTATLVLTDDAIEGGDVVDNPGGATTGTECPHGVEAEAGGTVTATGNRIYGGRCNLTSPANVASLFGLFVGGGAALAATNNMIHMGTSTIPQGGWAVRPRRESCTTRSSAARAPAGSSEPCGCREARPPPSSRTTS
jgi:hypothetical protein